MRWCIQACGQSHAGEHSRPTLADCLDHTPLQEIHIIKCFGLNSNNIKFVNEKEKESDFIVSLPIFQGVLCKALWMYGELELTSVLI